MKLEQIEELLSSFQGSTFASLDTITNVALKGGKKNEMQGRVTKRTSNNQVMLFTNEKSNGYENMVKRRLVAEGKDPESFTVGPLPWGERVPNTPLIKHKDRYYIQMIFNKSGNSNYFLDNRAIDKADITGLEERVGTGKQGLEEDNGVVVRTVALDSIIEIRLLGETVRE